MVSRIRAQISSLVLYSIMSLLFLGVLVTTLTGYFSLKQAYLQTLFSRQNVTLATILENINLSIQSQINTTKSIAENPAIIAYLKDQSKHANISAELKKQLTDPSDVVIIFSAQHRPIFSSDDKASTYDQNSTLQESIQRSQVLLDADISDIFFTPDKHPHIFITMPVMSENQFIGTIARTLNLNIIKKLSVEHSQIDDANEIIFVEKSHDEVATIFSSRSELNTPQTADHLSQYQQIFHNATNGKSGATITEDNSGEKLMLTWKYMPLTEWGTMLMESYDHAMEPFFKIKIYARLLALFFAICCMYLLYKAWSHRKKLHSLNSIFTKILSSILYVLFIGNIVLLLTFSTKKYQEFRTQQHNESLLFRGRLQQAAQTIDYRLTILETTAKTLALDIADGKMSDANITVRLKQEAQDNPEIHGILYAAKKGSSWEVISYFHENKSTENALAGESQEPSWIQQGLNNPAKWFIIKNQSFEDSQLIFPVPIYSLEDIEKTSPVGIAAIVYPMASLTQNAHQKLGTAPLLLALNNGTILMQDSGIPLEGPAINITRNTIANLYLAEITHLEWYLGSVLQPDSPYDPKLLTALVNILLLLSNMFIYIYMFLRGHAGMTPARVNKRLLIAALIIGLCTIIAYLFSN